MDCPLSPLLFILTLEPFLRMVNADPSIQGMDVRDNTYKVAAYADDLLFFITSPYTTIPNLSRTLEIYDYISNLKINYSKSEALNLTIPPEKIALLKANCPFKWETATLKYLGVWLTSSINTLYGKNVLPLLNEIEKDLRTWNKKFFSWFGRAAILKMSILPRLLYLLHTLLITVPNGFFRKLRALQTQFVWAHKPQE